MIDLPSESSWPTSAQSRSILISPKASPPMPPCSGPYGTASGRRPYGTC